MGYMEKGFVACLHVSKTFKKSIPQSSIVGMLLEHQEDYQIIKSNKIGFLQHDQFPWEIEDNNFIFTEKLTKDAKFADRTLTDWLKCLT